MFCLFITVCILALAKIVDNQVVYEVVNIQPLPVLESPSRDLRRFLQSPARSSNNRLRNNGSGHLNLPSPPLTVADSLSSQQLFIPRRDTYSTNYRTFIKSSDVATYSNVQDSQNNNDANDNINLEETPPHVIINGPPKNKEQRTQYETAESPGEDNHPDVTNVNFNNADRPSINNFKSPKTPLIYLEKSQTSINQPFPQRNGSPHTNPNNINKPNVHDREDNIENDKADLEDDKSIQSTTMTSSVTSKPSDLQVVNGTDIVNVTFGQRASFDGDKCPTGHIRVNGSTQCIPTD